MNREDFGIGVIASLAGIVASGFVNVKIEHLSKLDPAAHPYVTLAAGALTGAAILFTCHRHNRDQNIRSVAIGAGFGLAAGILFSWASYHSQDIIHWMSRPQPQPPVAAQSVATPK